ncbi:hypothetical protein [Micromonospora sp. NPDC005413]|uniref:hypothetical protein n=1 Tax=Micromonospora sp. NPDC005413 TaxID=3154563 RepID=UPI0033A33859
MTEPQHEPDQQTEPPAQPQILGITSPQPVTRTRFPLRWIVAGTVLVVLLCFGGCGVLLATTNGGQQPEQGKAAPTTSGPSASTPTSAAAPPTAAATTAPAAPAYDTPAKGDFKLKVKTLRKQCFGSAGCNITYRIDVTYTGDGLDPSRTYEVTYEVKGAEDPVINTFEVTGDSASVQQEETASTKRSGDKLTAVVTDVSEL